jgi:hypothetical protein
MYIQNGASQIHYIPVSTELYYSRPVLDKRTESSIKFAERWMIRSLSTCDPSDRHKFEASLQRLKTALLTLRR